MDPGFIHEDQALGADPPVAGSESEDDAERVAPESESESGSDEGEQGVQPPVAGAAPPLHAPPLLGTSFVDMVQSLRVRPSAHSLQLSTELLDQAELAERLPATFPSLSAYAARQLPLLAEDMRHTVEAKVREVHKEGRRRAVRVRARLLQAAAGDAGRVQVHLTEEDVPLPSQAAPGRPRLLLRPNMTLLLRDLGDGQPLLLLAQHSRRGRPDEPREATCFAVPPSQLDWLSRAPHGAASCLAWVLEDLTPSRRTWDSLQGLAQGQQVWGASTLPRLMLAGPQLLPPAPQPGVLLDEAHRLCSRRRLNASQVDAVLRCADPALRSAAQRTAAAAAGLGASPPAPSPPPAGPPPSATMNFVGGPPGTGKTTVNVTLAEVALRSGCRSLVVAPANKPVQDLAARLMRTSSPRLHLGDLVLVGSRSKRPEGGPLMAIWLEQRLEELEAAVRQLGTLKRQLQHLLGSTAAAFCLARSRGQVELPLAPWFLSRLQQLVEALRQQVEAMEAHLPSSFLAGGDFGRVRQLVEEAAQMLRQLSSLQPGLLLQLLQQSGTGLQLPEVAGARGAVARVLSQADASERLLERWGQGRSFFLPTCLGGAKVLFCTTSAAATPLVRTYQNVDICIIDEAGKLEDAGTANILEGWPDLRALALVGDDRQLSALIKSLLARRAGFGCSLMHRQISLGAVPITLDTQYRMDPLLSKWWRELMYCGPDGRTLVHDSVCVRAPSFKLCAALGPELVGLRALALIHSSLGCFQDHKNEWEAEAAVELVKAVRAAAATCGEGQQVEAALLCYFKAQAALVVSLLRHLGWQQVLLVGSQGEDSGSDCPKDVPCIFTSRGLVLEVNTVDAYQGMQKDVVIVSTASRDYATKFVLDRSRTLVACTRGRYYTWVLGDFDLLAEKDEVWRPLVEYAKREGCFREACNVFPLLKALFWKTWEKLDKSGEVAAIEALFREQQHWEVKLKLEGHLRGGCQWGKLDKAQKLQVLLHLHKLTGGHSVGFGPTSPKFPCAIGVLPLRCQGLSLKLVVSVGVKADADKLHMRQYLEVWAVLRGGHNVQATLRKIEPAYAKLGRDHLDRLLMCQALPNAEEARAGKGKLPPPKFWPAATPRPHP